MFNERNFRETQPKLFISKGVLSPARSNRSTKGDNSPNFDMQKWVNNLLVVNGLINADPCCITGDNAYVANFTAGAEELTINVPTSFDDRIVENHTAHAANVTATLEAAQLATGYITSTSAAAVSLTLPTATLLATELGATAGTSFEFIVDNTAGANTVTIIVGAGITAATPVITGGATLTVSVANDIGIFRIVFSSATVAKLYRIG
jgi:hypothetical protein